MLTLLLSYQDEKEKVEVTEYGESEEQYADTQLGGMYNNQFNQRGRGQFAGARGRGQLGNQRGAGQQGNQRGGGRYNNQRQRGSGNQRASYFGNQSISAPQGSQRGGGLFNNSQRGRGGPFVRGAGQVDVQGGRGRSQFDGEENQQYEETEEQEYCQETHQSFANSRGRGVRGRGHFGPHRGRRPYPPPLLEQYDEHTEDYSGQSLEEEYEQERQEQYDQKQRETEQLQQSKPEEQPQQLYGREDPYAHPEPRPLDKDRYDDRFLDRERYPLDRYADVSTKCRTASFLYYDLS